MALAVALALGVTSCAESDREPTAGTRATGRHLHLRRRRRPGDVRPLLRHRRRDLPRHPPDVRGTPRASSPAAPRSSPGWRPSGPSNEDGTVVGLHAPRRRDLPRRHPVQRRGGLRQLRADVRPERGRPGRRPSTGATSWAASPTTPEDSLYKSCEATDEFAAHGHHHPRHLGLPDHADAVVAGDAVADRHGGGRRQRHRRRGRGLRLPGVRPGSGRHRPLQVR